MEDNTEVFIMFIFGLDTWDKRSLDEEGVGERSTKPLLPHSELGQTTRDGRCGSATTL